MARGDLEKLLQRKILPCGLFIDVQYQYLAASPDGVIDDETIIEIKCPSTISSLHPIEGINLKKIKYATILNGSLQLRENSDYFFQVQGQLHISGRKKCIFCIWSPKRILIQTVCIKITQRYNVLLKIDTYFFRSTKMTIFGQVK